MRRFNISSMRTLTALALIIQLNTALAEDIEFSDVGVFSGGSPRLNIEVTDGLITLQAEEIPLRAILAELGRTIDMKLVTQEELAERRTLTVSRQPLIVVLTQLLRYRNYALRQTQSASSGQSPEQPIEPSVLWVYASEAPEAVDLERSHPQTATGADYSLLFTDDVSTRRKLVREARKASREEAITPLSLALSDTNPRVRLDAVYGLAELGGDQAVIALTAVLSDANPGVREEAVYALGQTGDMSAIPYLEHALGDSDRYVRELAVEALAMLGDQVPVRIFTIGLRDSDPLIRREAVAALGAMGGEAAINAIRTALEDEESHVKQAAQEALTELSAR